MSVQPAPISRRDALGRIIFFLVGTSIGNVLGCSKKRDSLQVFDEPENEEDINSGKILVLFGANWCGQCIRAGAFLKLQEKIFRDHGIKPYEFFQNLGIYPHKEWSPLAEKLKKEHEVSAIPTVLIFSEGRLIKKFVGAGTNEKDDISELPDWIEAHPKDMNKK